MDCLVAEVKNNNSYALTDRIVIHFAKFRQAAIPYWRGLFRGKLFPCRIEHTK
jgi:hypothetical protein